MPLLCSYLYCWCCYYAIQSELFSGCYCISAMMILSLSSLKRFVTAKLLFFPVFPCLFSHQFMCNIAITATFDLLILCELCDISISMVEKAEIDVFFSFNLLSSSLGNKQEFTRITPVSHLTLSTRLLKSSHPLLIWYQSRTKRDGIRFVIASK